MRTGRVVLFTDALGKKQIGQVTSINPAGGADVQTAPNAKSTFVEKFHKLRPISLTEAVNEFGGSLSNSGLSFPNGLTASLEQLGDVDLTDAVTAFIGVPIGEESVDNPYAPVLAGGDDDEGDDTDDEDDDEGN